MNFCVIHILFIFSNTQVTIIKYCRTIKYLLGYFNLTYTNSQILKSICNENECNFSLKFEFELKPALVSLHHVIVKWFMNLCHNQQNYKEVETSFYTQTREICVWYMYVF